MFDSILVATDGSDASSRALERACALASRFEAKLGIIHVLGHGPAPSGLRHMAEVEHLVNFSQPDLVNTANVTGNLAAAKASDTTAFENYKIWQAVGDHIVTQAKRTAEEAGIEARTFLDEGDACERILARAKDVGADVIIMGRRGLSDLKGLLMGSVTHKVSQLADCACLTVK